MCGTFQVIAIRCSTVFTKQIACLLIRTQDRLEYSVVNFHSVDFYSGYKFSLFSQVHWRYDSFAIISTAYIIFHTTPCPLNNHSSINTTRSWHRSLRRMGHSSHSTQAPFVDDEGVSIRSSNCGGIFAL